jgi:hypothetical protein
MVERLEREPMRELVKAERLLRVKLWQSVASYALSRSGKIFEKIDKGN